jgi:hypothetical protein
VNARQPLDARQSAGAGRPAGGRRRSTDDVAADLRLRMVSFDHRVQPPPDLFARVVAARPVRRRRARWSVGTLAAAGIAGLVLAVSVGVGWMYRSRAAQPAQPAQPPRPTHATYSTQAGGGLVLQVYNAERPCRKLRTVECGLGVYRDPRHPAPEQVVARVWHGDRVTVHCVVADGS